MNRYNSVLKVRPVNFPRENNEASELNIMKQLKVLIIVEAFTGINRIYLLQCRKPTIVLTNIYCLICLCVIAYQMPILGTMSAIKFALKSIQIIGYVLFVFMGMVYCKNTLRDFNELMHLFDKMLNIQNDLAITCSSKRILKWILATVFFNLVELGMVAYIKHYVNLFSLFCITLSTLMYDLELVFFCTLLRCIYLRILIIKAHVETRFKAGEITIQSQKTEVEKLSKRVKLDIESIHEAYGLLVRCAEKLNSAMCFPMLILFLRSGIGTITLLRFIISIYQMVQSHHEPPLVVHILFYLALRIFKSNFMLIFLCYYSSITTKQVSNICNILHNAKNSLVLEKIEKRKLKTLYLLTKECAVSYTLCGVIKLNMALPLRYTSLCITYLIIVIQFSKFLD